MDHQLGGARWLEGWKTMFVLEWFAWGWNAEQIRLYAVIAWGFATPFSVACLFKPEWRF